MLIGERDTGKSTLCRYLTHRWQAACGRCLLLDVDLGQPLLGPPGRVSLHLVAGPMLGLPSRSSAPLVSHCLGSVAATSDPEAYLAAVDSLAQTARALAALPAGSDGGRGPLLLVNSPGHSRGAGQLLLHGLVRLLDPLLVELRSVRWNAAMPLGLIVALQGSPCPGGGGLAGALSGGGHRSARRG
jgi:polynucleotide 5'-kinase involved in rRNA processing